MDNNNTLVDKIEDTQRSEQSTKNTDLVTVGSLKAEAKHGASHEEVTYNPKMPEPQIINGVKVYPTSFIPARAELHLPKKMLAELHEWHIETVHVAIFFILTFALFIGMWKRPNLR